MPHNGTKTCESANTEQYNADEWQLGNNEKFCNIIQ